MYKRERGLSNLADDDLIPLLLPDDKLKVIELYKGSKNFWRTRCNLELVFTYHVDYDCIEIMGYDNSKEMETSRLFVSASGASRRCQTSSGFEDNFHSKKVEFSRKRTKTTENSTTPAFRDYLCSYLLTRIDVEQTKSPVSTASTLPSIISPSFKTASVSSLMTMSSKSADTDDVDDVATDSSAVEQSAPLTPMQPFVLLKWTPVSSDVMDVTPDKIINYKLPYVIACPAGMEYDTLTLPKRVSTKAGDFERALSSLQMAQGELTKANKEANRLLNLTQLGATGFANGYAQRIKREATYSRAKKYWHMAYRRICTRNYIKHVTARLNKIYDNYFAASGAGTFPCNSSTAIGGVTAGAAFVKTTVTGKTSSLLQNSNSLPILQKSRVTGRHTIAISSPKSTSKSLVECGGAMDPNSSASANRIKTLQILHSAGDPSSPTATPRSKLANSTMMPSPVKGKL